VRSRSKYWKIVILAIFFSFVWGTWWGLYSYEQKNPKKKHGPEIRLLVQRGALPEKVVSEFQQQLNVDLLVTEEGSEVDLLREVLSHYQNYDVIELPSFVLKSFLLDNVLLPLNTHDVPNLSQVSIDFRHLDFDPDDAYLVPVSWGLTGFVVNTKTYKWQDETLESLLSGQAKVALLDSPVESMNVVSKVKPILKTWVETGQTEELNKLAREFRRQIRVFTSDPREQLIKGEVQVAQMQQGRVAKLVADDPTYQFLLPKERGILWIRFLGVSRGVKDSVLAHEVLNALLQPRMNRLLAEQSEAATVLTTLNDSDLPALQKAKFVRAVPLSRVELYVNHEALEPTWLGVYRQNLTAPAAK
jgi:spermidine/putrescine transport system substrate-binding protein